MENKIEVCFSPKLFDIVSIKENYIGVIVDILRATTSITAALEYGVKSIIPVATLEETKQFKENGYLVAAEREGKKLDFADYGNSPFDYIQSDVTGKEIVYTTTNGIQAILLAKNATKLVLGAFSNISSLSEYLIQEKKDVVILCSGWENSFCMEDTLFAGALTQKLIETSQFIPYTDSTHAAISLWQQSKNNLQDSINKMSHVNRLRKLDKEADIQHAFKFDTCHVVPILNNEKIIPLLLH